MIIYNHAPTKIPDPPLSCDICGYELRPKVPTSLRKFAADENDTVRCQRCEVVKDGGTPKWDRVKEQWYAE